MNRIRKCDVCKVYTLKEKCPKCGKDTFISSYKFKGLKDEEH